MEGLVETLGELVQELLRVAGHHDVIDMDQQVHHQVGEHDVKDGGIIG